MRTALSIFTLLLFSVASAQSVDTLAVYDVPEVSVTAQIKQQGLVDHSVAKTVINMYDAERE
ncbi:MAG: hypothetical protein IIW74_00130, partial [Rikenellaceae bacterium]|nr:hypothetical protein [Rikenellaceae bacterium]